MEKRKTNHKDDKLKLNAYRNWVSTILPIYKTELEKTQKDLSSFHSQNIHILSQTSFEVMNRHLIEETHSNVIAYLLKSKSGKILLRAILESLPQQKVKNINIEQVNKFDVVREKPTNDKKRIDLWIESDAFVIVIENKFNAKLHVVDKDTNQTDHYHKFTTDYCKPKHLKAFFILLDYKSSEKSKHYHPMDYSDLLNVLESVKRHFKDDLIYKEYVLLLQRLQKNIVGYSIDNAEEINNLTAINNLVEVLHNGFTK